MANPNIVSGGEYAALIEDGVNAAFEGQEIPAYVRVKLEQRMKQINSKMSYSKEHLQTDIHEIVSRAGEQARALLRKIRK